MARIGFNVVLRRSRQSLRSGVQRLSDSINKKITDLYSRVFGTSTSFDDWRQGRASSTERRLSQGLSTTFSQGSPLGKRLNKLYAEAWKRKYNKIIQDFKRADNQYPNKDWARWKRTSLGKRKPRHNSNEPIRFTTNALATGFLRQSILDGFESGGNQYLKVGNLGVQGAYELDFAAYPRRSDGKVHYEEFVNQMISLGVLSSQEDFISLLPGDVQRIIAAMSRDVRRQFVDEVVDIIDSTTEEF